MIVMDANAAMAIASGSADGEVISRLMQKDECVLAPSLLCEEMTHTLTRYINGNYFSAEEALACGLDALSLVDEFIDDGDLWIEVMNESVRLNHSSYDMFYFVLARRRGATLFTLDKKLQALCMKNGVNCIYTTKLED